MRTHTGVAAQMFRSLADACINIGMITTSEIKISALVSRDRCDAAALAVHAGFGLHAGHVTAPSVGLSIATTQFVSEPDGNTVKLQVIRPESDVPLPGVYYIHGGGMASMSCFDGMYRGWGKHIAANGVVVVMVDFRNCVSPSSAPEVAPKGSSERSGRVFQGNP